MWKGRARVSGDRSAELRSDASRFLCSRDPIVILEVPGCQAKGVNPAHHERGDCPRITTAAEYIEVIRACAESQANRHAALLHACYCLLEKHILALRFEDCVYEDRYIVFRRFGRRVLPGLEFTHTGTAHGVRTYRVSRVHAKVHFPLQHGEQERGVIEARLVDSGSLELAVTGDARQGSMSGSVCIAPSGEQVLPPIPAALDRDAASLDLYRKLDDVLSAVKGMSAEAARPELDGFLKSIDDTAYSLVRDIVDDVKGDPSRAEEYAVRLWDAPFVSRSVRIPLEGWLANLDPEWLDGLPRHVAAGINRLTMPLSELEGLDALRTLGRTA